MSIALTTTWQPHGELPRLQRFHQRLRASFESITIVMPPTVGDMLVAALSVMADVYPIVTQNWARGRHVALYEAIKRPASHVLYCDLDRLIHWVELYPDELEAVALKAQTCDCLVVGRTARALMTHPRSLRETEQIANDVFAHVIGRAYDICVATRGFSQAAAAHVMAASRTETSLGVDGEWVYLCQQAGFTLEYAETEGMEWETPDQNRDQAADAETRRAAADAFDAEASSWPGRVRIARAIIQGMLAAAKED
jgi:hypothetical protein